jgi:hypothetical protein
MQQNSQWVWTDAGIRVGASLHGGARQSTPSCSKRVKGRAAPTAGTHLREGAIEVVGVAWVVLKAAVACVLGKGQRGEQAHQQVAPQAPARGV